MAHAAFSQKHTVPKNTKATPPPPSLTAAAGNPAMDLKNGNSYKNDNFAREKQRRAQLNDNYQVLRRLIPNVTKVDRVSVVRGAIEYIKELTRRVNELKLLVRKKKLRGGNGRHSWMQRKSEDTEVDVRIRDDQVTIKLIHRKNIDCLLFVSKLLHQLHLDLNHLEGGFAGDYCCIFLFKTKIYEGSSIDASAIANKVIEVLDMQQQ